MNISVAYIDATTQPAALLVIGAWEGEQLAPPIAALIEADDWSGTFKKTLLIYPRGALPARARAQGRPVSFRAAAERAAATSRRRPGAGRRQPARSLSLPSVSHQPE